MTHYMNLVPSAFAKIADGSKTIELRLNDEKRQKINIGDTIIFRCTENGDCITATVKQLHKFANFEELYKALPLTKCGYNESELETAHHTDMEVYYPKEKIQKYGALGIEICDVVSVCDVKDNITDFKMLELLAPSVYSPTPERLLNRAKKYSENKDANIYAYRDNGEYKGIIVFEIKEKSATIFDIAVKPEYQGKGIGSRLIDYIFNRFEANKVIAETDDDAIDFYKKYGFVVTNTKLEFGTKRYVVIKEQI